MGDDAGAIGAENFLYAAGRDVPGISIAAGTVEAGLFERSVRLRARVGGQQRGRGSAAVRTALGKSRLGDGGG